MEPGCGRLRWKFSVAKFCKLFLKYHRLTSSNVNLSYIAESMPQLVLVHVQQVFSKL